MKPALKKTLAACAVVAVIAVPFAVKSLRGPSGTEVELATVAAQDVRPTILASGTLTYRTEVNLTSEVVAKVTDILVREGDTVERGQLLLRLDPETYRNAIEREDATRRQSRIGIERQRAALALREAQFERSRQLLDSKIIDRNRFEEDRYALELARAELRSSTEAARRSDAVVGEAREQLGKTDIRAPIAGRIVELPIKVGETAIPSTNALAGAKLMKLADTSAILAELKVDEADIARVAVGQQVDVFPAAYPDTALRGTVETIALAPTIEGQVRAYKVTVQLKGDGKQALRSGMSARADIFLGDGARKVAVPVEAVVTGTDDDKKTTHHVWVNRDGSARKVPVTLGVSDDQWQVVATGLKAGDVAITGPAKTLRGLSDGTRVIQVKEKQDDAEPSDESGDGDASA